MDIDAALNRLSEILSALENKKTSLHEIPNLIKEASEIKKACEKFITETEASLEVLNEKKDSNESDNKSNKEDV